ncbi:putative RNA-directed DNA polymerase [Helianthus debilis subsp. tardiflorus]
MESEFDRNGEDGGGPWTDVHYNKQWKSRGNGVEMTFIVQNLPESTSKTVLRKAFQPLGYVSDAYVARKKDKKGKCFGFIRLMGVENVDAIVVEMNRVLILNSKVSVSLAKYDKNHKKFIYTSKFTGGKVWRAKEPTFEDQPNNHAYDFRGSKVQSGKSFASLFHNGTSDSNEGQLHCAKTISIVSKGSKYPLHCRGRSIHGVAKDLETINNMNKLLTQEGLRNFGLSYIGGLSVLVTLGTPELVRDVMTNYSENLSKVFRSFQVWKGDDLPTDRIVYLRVSGVPVHLRDSSVYDDIGGLFGKVVQESSFSWVDSDNSEGSTLVLVPLGKRIEETVVINWENRRYVVWVVEDVDAWKPDLEEENTVAMMVDNPVREAAGESGGINVGNRNMENDMEDGEIRSPTVVNKSPVREVQQSPLLSSDQPSVPNIEASVGVEKSDVNVGLHEKAGKVYGECSMPRESNYFNNGVNGMTAGAVGGNPTFLERESPLMDQVDNDGPTPIVGLGKRNRNIRSPPSSESMEGPPVRGFCHDPTGDPLFDLNRPSSPADSGNHESSSNFRHGGLGIPVPNSEPNDPGLADMVDVEVADTVAVGDLVAAVDSVGRSGGLASLWNPAVFSSSEIIKDRYFLCVCGYIVPLGIRINIVNVYAPNDASARKALWSVLISLRNSRQGLWVFAGDFNDVRSPDERKNSEFVAANAEAFNDFILSAALHEFDMGGAKFTYISDRGDKLSKLDRFLVCIGFVESWPGTVLTALDRRYSDHRPLLLSTTPNDFGHIPFRFYNSWLEKQGFMEFIFNKCNQFSFFGPGDLALATKLRWLKYRIKEWVSADKRRTKGMYSFHKSKVDFLESLAEVRDLNQAELDARMEHKQFLACFDEQKHMDERQKSRIRWAIQGDENTGFFHATVNANLSSSRINGIFINEVWVTNPICIKNHFFEFYSQLFSEPMQNRPLIVLESASRLSVEEGVELTKPFSLTEIKDAVWECDGDRAPGPDGFNFKFLKRCWNGLQGDFINLFNAFYNNPCLNVSCSSSFIALIPKIKDPLRPSDFRPISLIGCINKVISKVLVNRLKNVIHKLIAVEQTAFLAGRNIVDGPLMLNELVAWLKLKKKAGMIFKVDIHKAYDSLSWGFLNSIMEQMGFPLLWRNWIMGILQSARASVLVNGSPTMEFSCTRGLRQGDPISPFLFLIAMEALSGMMKKASECGIFHGINCNNGGSMILSHLSYADDVIFLGDWSVSNALNIRRILRCFFLASGLKVNLSKCSLFGVGVEAVEVENMANVLHCRAGSFPFKYLGLQVGANMNLARNWKPIIDLFKSRLSIWKAKKLSYGGRITLLKSVLSALPTYYFSLYKAPVLVINQLERLRRVFFWGRFGGSIKNGLDGVGKGNASS